MAYADAVGQEINGLRDQLQAMLDERGAEGTTEVRRSELLADMNALDLKIVDKEKEYTELGRFEAAAEGQRIESATVERAGQLGIVSQRAGARELTFERAEVGGGLAGTSPALIAQVPSDVSLARAFMESEPFKNARMNMGTDVILTGVFDRAFGSPITRSDTPIDRAAATYGVETQNTERGFRTQIPFTGGVVLAGAYEPMAVDVIPRVNVSTLTVRIITEQLRGTGATNTIEGTDANLSVGENDPAFEATYRFLPETLSLKRKRMWTPVTEEALSDPAMLGDILENEMVDRLRRSVSASIIQQDGSGDNMSGFAMTRTGQQNTPVVLNATPAANMETAINTSLLNVRKGYGTPTAILVQAEAVDAFLNADKSGRYIFEPTRDPALLRWRGVPIMPTFNDFPAYAATSLVGLVGDFARFTRHYTMGDISVATSNSHGTLFTQFATAIRAGYYSELAVRRNSAFCTITRTA